MGMEAIPAAVAVDVVVAVVVADVVVDVEIEDFAGIEDEIAGVLELNR